MPHGQKSLDLTKIVLIQKRHDSLLEGSDNFVWQISDVDADGI